MTEALDIIAPIITADDQISYEVNSIVTANDFLKEIHATTDDGSPITSDFDQVVDMGTPGVYEVTLTSKDAANNEAIPFSVTVIVTEAPTKNLDDNQNSNFDTPIVSDNSDDNSKNNFRNGTNNPLLNQTTKKFGKYTGDKSNVAFSSINTQHQMRLPKTGEMRSTMYPIILGLFLLTCTCYTFFQKNLRNK